MPGDAGTFWHTTCWPHIADWCSLTTVIVVAGGPHHSALTVVLGFSRFVREVKWRHHTLAGTVRGIEARMDTEKHGICVYYSNISKDRFMVPPISEVGIGV